MSPKTTKQKLAFFAAVGVGTAIGNILGREMWDSQSTTLSLIIGAVAGAASALIVVGIFSLLSNKQPDQR